MAGPPRGKVERGLWHAGGGLRRPRLAGLRLLRPSRRGQRQGH